MEEAERLCDRVAIVDQGKVLAIDGTRALLATHGGRSVVDVEFEDAPPMRIETDRPPEAVAELAKSGAKFTAIRVERPTLESVFLKLTGRRLRD
jgi:ABC-2 type transport system ATP-binding protein